MQDNLLKYRLFPRYDISKLSFSLHIIDDNLQNKPSKFELMDVSLSGTRIIIPSLKDVPDHLFKVSIVSDNFKFTISAKKIWYSDYNKQIQMGLKLFFEDLDTLNGWIGFIKALHYLSMKSSFELPDVINRF